MAPALPLSIFTVILSVSWSSALTSTDSPLASPVPVPVPAPPLEDLTTTSSSPPPGLATNVSLLVPDRHAKAIRFTSVSGNEVDSVLSPEDELGTAAELGGLSDPAAENETNPLAAFRGIVSECLWALSVPCLQRKLLIFVNRVSRRDRFSVLGDRVALVRVWGDAPAAISEDILAERVASLTSADPSSETAVAPDEEHLLDALTQSALDDLLYSHAIRLRLPTWLGSYTGARSISAIDVDLDDLIETGRQGGTTIKKGGTKIKIKKKKKKGGGKMMKKMMKGMAKMGGMMMTMLLGKVAVLAPLLKIMSAIALKAATLALLLSKILLVQRLFSGGVGGGAGGLSSIFSGLKSGLGGGGGGTPGSSYGAPAQQPASSYGAPQQPASSYGAPQQPASSYGAPQQPASSYGAPQQSSFGSSYNPPSTSYGTPTSSYNVPSSNFGGSSGSRPSSRPSSSYAAPSSSYGAPSFSSAPTAPPAAPSSSYGSPAAQNSYAPPSKDYGAPTGGGSSWSSGGGFTSTGTGGGSAGSGSSSGSSSGGAGGGGGGGYVGGGSHWANRRGWDSYSVEATTEVIDQYNQ